MSDPRDVVNERVLPAPRDSILEAYRDPEQLKLWWGPNGFTNTFHTFEFRPGGAWHYTMHGPDGADYRNESVFLECGPERVVVDHLRPMHRFLLTMSLDDLGDATRVRWHLRFETVEECAKVRPWVDAGNEQNLDRLTAHLADLAKREMRLTRVLAAPRALVWKAWTDPNHVGTWWGPDGFTTTTYAMDVRPGGEWRYDMHGPDGRVYPNRIRYLEVIPPERLVYTHGGDEHKLELVSFHTAVTFADEGGATRLTMRSIFPSEAELARVIREYGANTGAVQHLANLAKHLETM